MCIFFLFVKPRVFLICTERQKSCTTFHFDFYLFKTDYFKFKFYSDDVPVSEDYFCHKFECIGMPGNSKALFW